MAGNSSITEAYKLLGYDTTLLEKETHLEDLHKSESFRAASEQLYFLKEGSKAPPLKDGAAYIAYGIDKMRWAQNNIIAGGNGLRQLIFKANDEQKVAMLYLTQTYAQTNSTWMGRGLAIAQGVIDPSLIGSVIAGAFSFGTGAAAGLAGRTAAVEGMQLALREGAERLVSRGAMKYVAGKLTEKSVTGAFVRGALPGLLNAAAQGIVDQGGALTDIKINGQNHRSRFSGFQYATALGTGAAVGGGLGFGGHVLARLNERFGITDSINNGLRHLFGSEAGMVRITGNAIKVSPSEKRAAGAFLAHLMEQSDDAAAVLAHTNSDHAKALAKAWKVLRPEEANNQIVARMHAIEAAEGALTDENFLARHLRATNELVASLEARPVTKTVPAAATSAATPPAPAAVTPPPIPTVPAAAVTPPAIPAAAVVPPIPTVPAATVASAVTPPSSALAGMAADTMAIAHRLSTLSGRGSVDVTHQIDHAAEIVDEAMRRGIKSSEMYDLITREVGVMRAGEGKTGLDGLLDDRWKVLQKFKSEPVATPAATVTVPPAAASAATPTPSPAAATSGATPTPAAATSAATPPASAGPKLSADRTVPLRSSLTPEEYDALDNEFAEALKTRVRRAEDGTEIPVFADNHISTPKYDPKMDRLKFRVKYGILNEGFDLPSFHPAPLTNMAMDPRPVVRPVIEAVDKLLGSVDQATTGTSTRSYKVKNFLYGDGAGRPEKVIDAVDADSFLGKMARLEKKLIADAERGHSQVEIAKVIDDFKKANSHEMTHLSAELSKIRQHVEDEYLPHRIADTFEAKGKTLPAKDPMLAIKSGVYGKYGMTFEQAIQFTNYLDDIILTLDDLQKGSLGKQGRQMIATTDQIKSGAISVAALRESVSGLSHADSVVKDATTRLTGLMPNSTKQAPWEWRQALENTIQNGRGYNPEHPLVPIVLPEAQNIEKQWQNQILPYFRNLAKKQGSVDENGVIKTIVWAEPDIPQFAKLLKEAVYDKGYGHEVFYMIDDLARRAQQWQKEGMFGGGSAHGEVLTLPSPNSVATILKGFPEFTNKDPKYAKWVDDVEKHMQKRLSMPGAPEASPWTLHTKSHMQLNRPNINSMATRAYYSIQGSRWAGTGDVALPARNLKRNNFVTVPLTRIGGWLAGAESTGTTLDWSEGGLKAVRVWNAGADGKDTGYGLKNVGRMAVRFGSGLTLDNLDWKKPWRMPTKLGWGLAGVALVGGLGQAADMPSLSAPADATMTAYTTVIPAIPGAHRLTAVLGGTMGGAVGGVIAGAEAGGSLKADSKDGFAVAGGKFVGRRIAGVVPGAWEGIKLGWGAGGDEAPAEEDAPETDTTADTDAAAETETTTETAPPVPPAPVTSSRFSHQFSTGAAGVVVQPPAPTTTQAPAPTTPMTNSRFKFDRQ